MTRSSHRNDIVWTGRGFGVVLERRDAGTPYQDHISSDGEIVHRTPESDEYVCWEFWNGFRRRGRVSTFYSAKIVPMWLSYTIVAVDWLLMSPIVAAKYVMHQPVVFWLTLIVSWVAGLVAAYATGGYAAFVAIAMCWCSYQFGRIHQEVL